MVRVGLTERCYAAPEPFLDVVSDILEECTENAPEILDRTLEEFHIKIEQRVERLADIGPTVDSRDDLLHIAVMAVTALAKITREGAEVR